MRQKRGHRHKQELCVPQPPNSCREALGMVLNAFRPRHQVVGPCLAMASTSRLSDACDVEPAIACSGIARVHRHRLTCTASSMTLYLVKSAILLVASWPKPGARAKVEPVVGVGDSTVVPKQLIKRSAQADLHRCTFSRRVPATECVSSTSSLSDCLLPIAYSGCWLTR